MTSSNTKCECGLTDLTSFSLSELSDWIQNEEGLYNMRFSPVLDHVIRMRFKFTPEQLAYAIEEIKEEMDELAA